MTHLQGHLRSDQRHPTLVCRVTRRRRDVAAAATYSGLILDAYLDDQLARLHDTVASVVERVRGPEANRYDTGVPHFTLAYANADADSDEIQRKLRRVRPSHAPMTIRSVHLFDVAADPDANTITWATPIAEVMLAR
jgi:hypothetical protein